jgi:hypothetical protein
VYYLRITVHIVDTAALWSARQVQSELLESGRAETVQPFEQRRHRVESAAERGKVTAAGR